MDLRFFRHFRPVLGAVLALGIAAGGSGCSNKLSDSFRPNLAPTVRLTHAPLNSQSREKYSYRMNWVGYDPDGRVDYFLYKIDPANPDAPDSSWTSTTRNEETIDFDAGSPDEPVNHNASAPTIAASPHVFAIVAVDNKGKHSPAVYRAFFATTVAPFVWVESPKPNETSEPLMTPSVRITYNGTDADGPTGRPERFVFRLFGRKNPDFPEISDFISFSYGRPDSFRKLYAPSFNLNHVTWQDNDPNDGKLPWQSSPADTTEVQYQNLIPLSQYLFVATGFDKAGAYDPIFSRRKNMLLFNVSFGGTRGPLITMYNEFFNYTYDSAGWSVDPSRFVRLEVPADRPVTFNWFATPPQGADMRRYRWVLDLEILQDETERENQNDWYHWSAWSLNNTSATIGPFSPPQGRSETHFFYIEAEDNIGLKSLGIIQFVVVRPTFENQMLIVQDCRLSGDRVVNGVYQTPAGSWPNKAELDTFFYAVGGQPWRGAYAAGGYESTPGVFSGYAFDTMSTRGILSGILPLSTLGQYKYVVWYVDDVSAGNLANPSDLRSGSVSLRWMSSRNQPNTLATYMQQGGNVWLFGGGGAFATLHPWNRSGTDPNVYTFRDNELIQGRFMYDYAHWRSRVDTKRILRFATLNWNYPRFNSQTPSRGWDGAPSYNRLITQAPVLTGRDRNDPADAPPPLRNADSFWYDTDFLGEVITDPNFILEDLNGDLPGGEISTLDTIYISGGGQAEVNERPIMTYYHGRDFRAVNLPSEPEPFPDLQERAYFVFSGFPVWFFKRTHQVALVDFVLQDIWGIQPEPVARAAVRLAASSPTGRRLAPQVARPQRVSPSPMGRRLLPQTARPIHRPGVQR